MVVEAGFIQLHQLRPGFLSVEQQLAAQRRVNRAQDIHYLAQLGQFHRLLAGQRGEWIAQRAVDALGQRRVHPCPLRQVVQTNGRKPDHIARQVVFQLQLRILRLDGQQVEAQVALLLDQPVRPAGNAARHIGVGAFQNQAHIRFTAKSHYHLRYL